MVVISVIIFIFGIFGIIIGSISLKVDATNIIYYLFLFGGLLITFFGWFIFSKTESGEDLILWYQETRKKIRFKLFVKKYQSDDYYQYYNRYDIKRICQDKDMITVYNTLLCYEFDIEFPNKFYNLLVNKNIIAVLFNAYLSICMLDYNYEEKLNLLTEYANKGNNYARSLLFNIYYLGVKNNDKEIKVNEKLAMKYIDAAINDKSLYAVETLISVYNTKEDYKKADELIEKYNLKNTNIHFTTLADAYFYGIGFEKNYKKALSYYKRTLLSKYDLNKLAECYLKLKDYNSALKIYKDLMKIGNNEGTVNYAELLYLELGKQKKAFRILNKLYKEGYKSYKLIFRLAYAYETGIGVKKDVNKAIELYKICIKEYNNLISINNLAALYKKENLKDDNEVFKLYELASNQGDNFALCNVGICYEEGKGVTKDINKALECYKKASENGEQRGTYLLGVCYYKGKGVTKNLTKALELLNSAQDYYLSHFMLGEIQYFEYKNYNASIKHYLKFVEILTRKNIISQEKNYYRDATFSLGYSYDVMGNYKEAIKYYKIAVDYSSSIAANNLSIIYRKGLGVVKDDNLADYYLEKAKQLKK